MAPFMPEALGSESPGPWSARLCTSSKKTTNSSCSTPKAPSSSNIAGPNPVLNTSAAADVADPEAHAKQRDCQRCPDTSSVRDVLMQIRQRCPDTSHPTRAVQIHALPTFCPRLTISRVISQWPNKRADSKESLARYISERPRGFGASRQDRRRPADRRRR